MMLVASWCRVFLVPFELVNECVPTVILHLSSHLRRLERMLTAAEEMIDFLIDIEGLPRFVRNTIDHARAEGNFKVNDLVHAVLLLMCTVVRCITTARIDCGTSWCSCFHFPLHLRSRSALIRCCVR